MKKIAIVTLVHKCWQEGEECGFTEAYIRKDLVGENQNTRIEKVFVTDEV